MTAIMNRPIAGGRQQRNSVRIAENLRAFIDALFGSKLVAQLRADLTEAKAERDYFRGQFERMQLLAVPRTAPVVPRQPRPEGATQVGARKSWGQIVAENTQKQNELAAKESEKPKN
jgi:hypothetical protein